jgi:hypothetical protein
MVIETPFLHCFFCSCRFAADLEAREGGFVHAWKVAVCVRCFQGNPTGPAAHHPALKKLANQGIAIKATREGIVPWPEEGRQVPSASTAPMRRYWFRRLLLPNRTPIGPQ